MENKEITSTRGQLIALTALRVLIGWHLLYEGIVKVLNPDWSAAGFLRDSGWILSGFFHWIAATPGVLRVVDALNACGLTLIGAGLMLGLFTRASMLAGIVLILFYYLAAPPLTGLYYNFPAEGNYLIVNKTLLEAASLAVLLCFPAAARIGLDRLFFRGRK